MTEFCAAAAVIVINGTKHRGPLRHESKSRRGSGISTSKLTRKSHRSHAGLEAITSVFVGRQAANSNETARLTSWQKVLYDLRHQVWSRWKP
jgi:hypothetical protein